MDDLREAAKQALTVLKGHDFYLLAQYLEDVLEKDHLLRKELYEFQKSTGYDTAAEYKASLVDSENCERCDELASDKATWYRMAELFSNQLHSLKKKEKDQQPVAWLNDREELYFDKEDAMRYSDGFIQPLYTRS